MDTPEQPGTGDEFEAQVSDVRSAATPIESPSADSPLAFRRSVRRRMGTVAALAAALVALAVIVLASPALRAPALGLFSGLQPTPTATILPGENLFYLLPNPPGVDVSLDGKALTRVPVLGDAQPLRLAPGRHFFAWRSHLFPFQPQQCSVTVPQAPSDTCTYGANVLSPADIAHPLSRLIGMHESLATLLPGPATQLRAAIQAALDARRSTALIQPSEWYNFYDNAAGQGGPIQARQPLRATLSYYVQTDRRFPEPCAVNEPGIPCRFPGQDCTQLCTVAQPPASLAGVGTEPAWIAGVTIGSMWNCTTLNGQAVGCVEGEFDLQLAALRIQWDGSDWHVSAIMGHMPGLDVADDAACDPARFALSPSTSWSFMLTNPPSGARVQFVSDATPIDGCVAVLDQAPGHDTPAVFLYRFSVLLTVNATAVNPSDNLPAADAAEQALAHELAAQAQVTF